MGVLLDELNARRKKQMETEKPSLREELSIRKDSANYEELSATNQSAADTINRYQETMKSGGYLSAEDLTAYKSAVDTYTDTGNRMRSVARYFGVSLSDEDVNAWNDQASVLSGNYDSAYQYYSKYKNEEAYKSAQESAELLAMKLASDTTVLRQELDDINAMAEQYRQNDRQLKEYLLNPEISGISERQAKVMDSWLRQMERDYSFSGSDGLDSLITQKQQYLNDAERLQAWDSLGAVGNPEREEYDPHFDQYSGYVSTVSDEAFMGMYDYDPEYEAVNNRSSGVSMATIFADISRQYSSEAGDTSYLDYLEFLDSLTNMHEEEVATYNYYYAKHGKETAREYLESIQDVLNSRSAENVFADFKGNVVLEEVFAVAAGLDQFDSGMKGLFNSGGEYVPASTTQQLSGMIREDLADVGPKLPEWLGGSSLGQGVYDTISTTANMAPSILASVAVGMVSKTAGVVVGNTLLGASAAGNAYQEKLNLGYSKEQASAYGALVGASEASLQYLLGGIGKLGGKLTQTAVKNLSKIDNILARVAQSTGGKLLANGLSEGAEEYLQAVLEPYLWKAVSGEEMSADSAEALYSALLGFVTGGLFEGGEIAQENHQYTKTGREILANGGLAGLQELAAGVSRTDAKIAKMAAKVSNKSTGSTARQVGRLYRAVSEAVDKQNRLDLTNSLIQKQIDTETAQKIADVVIDAQTNPDGVTDAQVELLATFAGDEKIAQAVNEALNNEQSAVYQRNAKLKAITTAVNKDTSSVPRGEGSTGAVQDEGAAKQAVSSMEGKTFVQSTGEVLENVKFASVEQGKATVALGDGKTASLSDVSFADEGQDLVASGITSMEYVSVPSANGIWQIYQQGNYGDNAGGFTKAAMLTFRAGFMGDATVLKQGDSRSAALDPVHTEMIYQMGREDAEAYYKAKQAKLDAQKKATAEKSSTAEKKGGVYYGYDGKTIEQRKVDEEHKRLTKAQRVGIDFVKRLAKKFGTQFYFYESYTDEAGNRVYKDPNGNVVEAENGYYDPKDGSIHIDLTGDNILFTISHELVHFIKDWSPKQFKKMADIVMTGYSRENVSLDKLINDQQKLAKEHGRELTEKEAFEEVIANALEGVMTDGRVMEFLRDIEGKDKTLGAKVRQFFRDIAQLIKDTLDAYAGVKPGTVEGRMTMQLEDVYKQLQAVFAEGVYEAGENFRQAEKNTTGEGGVRYQARLSTKNPSQLDPRTVTREDVRGLLKNVKAGKYAENTYIPVRISTPGIVQERLFAENLPMAMPVKKVMQAFRADEGPIKGKNVRGHNLKVDDLLYIIEHMDSPDYLFSQPDGRGIAVLKMAGATDNTAVIIEFGDDVDAPYMNGYESGKYNISITAFDIDDGDIGLFMYQMDKAWRKVFDKEKEGDPAKKFQATRPFAIEQDSLSANVSQPNQEVKENDSAKSGIRASIRQKQNPTVADMLKKENEKLKGDVEKLKELLKLQRTITGGTKFTASSVEAAARVLKKSAGATGETAELAGLLNSFYAYIATERELTWEGVKEQAKAAVDWLQDHVKHRRSDYAQEVLDQIHGSRIYLDESQKKEAAYRFGSFNDFRKTVMGSITVANDANMSLDSWWQEMASMYPDVFDAELTASDMPGALADIIDRLRNEDTSLLEYEYNRDIIEQDLMRQVYDTYWNVSTLRTFADVKQGQINRLKSEHLQRMNQLKAENRQKVEQLKAQHRSEVKMIRSAYRQKLETQQKEISARYQESRAKAVEGRHKTEMRHKIQKVVKKLNDLLLKETRDKHVPENLKKVVAEALDAVNMDTVGAEERVARYDALIAEATDPDVIEALTQTRDRIQKQGDRMQDRLRALKDAYEELQNAEGDIANAYDEDLAGYIKELANEVGDTPLRDMTLAQLETVYEVYTAVLTTVRNANKAFKEAKGQSIREMGEAVLGELRALKQRNPEQSQAKLRAEEFFWNNEKPIYAFERIGSKVLSMLYRNLQAGQDTYMTDQLDAKAFANAQKKKHGYDKWDFERRYKFVSSHGDSFELSLSQIMSLHAYAKRDQAREHIRKGGIVFDGATELTKKGLFGVKKKVKVENSTAYNISDEVLAQICGSLTQAQAAFVDEMQRYLSDNMGAKGNEVSMALYGIRLFKEKHYFPLKSAPEYMEKAREQQNRQADVKLKNSGMTKATVPKASNPVVLTPFMDVWADHVVDMSMYHSFVLPLEDFYRVYNFKTGQALEEGQTVSVISAINRAHGKAATRYVDQFLKDLNGGVVADPRESIGKALVSKFKKASVMASASVVVQQPTAVVRAMAMIDARHFHGEKIGEKKMSVLWDEAKKYAPIAAVKEMGYFDTHMGRSARDYLLAKEYHGIGQMAKGVLTDSEYRDELLSKPAAMADQIAWVWIWNAVKRETGAKHPNLYATDRAEFFRIAGERYTDVISRTQVYDSVFSRSANMRSKSIWMNMVTSFMGEPTTTGNMLESALRQWRGGAKKSAWRTVCGVYGSVLLNSLVVAVVYAMRDDDEDEHFLEKYATAFTGKLLEGINPMTYFPFVRDIWSLMQGYDVERADMSVLSDLISAISRVITLAAKETADMNEEKLAAHNKKIVDAILNLVDSGFSIVGIPEKNIRRDIMAVVNTWKMVVDGVEFDFSKLINALLGEVKDNVPVVNMLPD